MIVEYNDRGEIHHEIHIHQEGMAAHLRELGHSFLELDYKDFENKDMNGNYWVDTSGEEPALKPRPASPVAVSKVLISADDVDTFEITGLAEGWEITIDGSYLEFVPGEPLEISSAIAHEYEIIAIAPWPYISTTFKVKAV